MLKDRKVYESTLDGQLALWQADLEVLKAQTRRAGVGARVSYDKALDALEHKQGEADRHLRNLKAASDDAWEGAKASTEVIWQEMKALVKSCAKKP